ncbi:MAG TPA: M28 family peptidase [Anaerolineales bacterium]|nr:M28 family peptidase [Anaerolineales bacterium]
MSKIDAYTQHALDHIRYLSEDIGGRGSCTPKERAAAEYTAEQMRTLKAQNVRLEPYRGAPSTYRPYALAFAAGLLGALLAWIFQARWALILGALLNALGAWGMLAETDFANNWTRWPVPKAPSQNAVGVIPPQGQVRQRAVLCAHVDTHRTPIFYSSKSWQTLFSLLVGSALFSMVISTLVYALGGTFGWSWARWIGLAAALMEAFALVMSLHADFTPFSPGANDNASGVGVILGLAERLKEEPLANTEIWLVFTGCEEAAAYGMSAFLDRHATELGEEAVYIIIDQVGKGRIEYLTADGLIIKRATHPQALRLAREAAATLPDLQTAEQVGIAYTDAAVATKRGLIALTLVAVPPPGSSESIHWHQVSDTSDAIDLKCLINVHTYAWQLLQILDHPSPAIKRDS